LKEDLCRRLPREQWFTPSQMVRGLTEQGLNLRLLIDLTNTDRYYHPKELQDLGVDYSKIAVVGHEVPGDFELKRFCDIVDRFENEHRTSAGGDESIVIGVHCTHGINRTGYLVCRYLIDRKGWSAEVAINEFNRARGHSIERENYLAALRGSVSNSASSSVERPWKQEIMRQTHYQGGGNWSNFAPNKKIIFDQDGESRLSVSFDEQYRNLETRQGQWQNHHGNSNYRWNRNQSDNYRRGYGQWSPPEQHNSRYAQGNYGWRQDPGAHRPQHNRDNYYHPYHSNR